MNTEPQRPPIRSVLLHVVVPCQLTFRDRDLLELQRILGLGHLVRHNVDRSTSSITQYVTLIRLYTPVSLFTVSIMTAILVCMRYAFAYLKESGISVDDISCSEIGCSLGLMDKYGVTKGREDLATEASPTKSLEGQILRFVGPILTHLAVSSYGRLPEVQLASVAAYHGNCDHKVDRRVCLLQLVNVNACPACGLSDFVQEVRHDLKRRSWSERRLRTGGSDVIE